MFNLDPFSADACSPSHTAAGFRRMFAPGRLTLGVFFPIEAFEGDRPTMADQERLAKRAEKLGFAALWFRDAPLRDPQFGDVGQVFDPWGYLGYIAAHADGWITYPRPLATQAKTIATWRQAVADAVPGAFKPFAQSLYIDLAEDPAYPPVPIHPGFSGGRKAVTDYLVGLRDAGANHVVLNLKYGRRSASDVLEEIGQEILPVFGRTPANGLVPIRPTGLSKD